MKALYLKLIKNKILLALVLIFILGTFLRFYKIAPFITFLGDQGRDAIILKRIVTLEHLPAIGPPTSIGQVYLGPFYYYFIAPWLLIFNFNPVGPAFGVAFFSTLFILISFFVVRDIFDEKTAFFSSIFITFSSVIIEYSRFSWNPNLLPFFSLLYFYFLYKSQKDHKIIWYILFGTFLSLCIQLHYLALFLIPATLILFIYKFFLKKVFNLKVVKGLVASFISFLLFSSPLIIFDLRHNFLNLNNFINLSKSTSGPNVNLLKTINDSFNIFNSYIFKTNINIVLSFLFLAFILTYGFLNFKKSKAYIDLLIIFILTFIGIALYGGQKFPHYFGVIYLFYFIILSYFLSLLSRIKYFKYLTLLFFTIFIYLNSQGYVFLYNRGNYQIEKAERISRVVFKNINSDKYTITSLPGDYSDTTYRYFLEVWGKKPFEKDSTEKADELFVVCEKECDPRNSAQWDIAFFAADKIEKVFIVNNVKIYKLVRN